jgi:hypothetical protein
VTASTGVPEALSAANVRSIINVADGANNYTLPTATDSVLGGVKVGTGLAIADGVLSATGGAGAGDVIGPATNTDNKVPQWNGANSKTLKDGLTVGTGANNLVQLDASSKLPAVDGSALTNLPSGFSDPMTTRGDIIYRASGGTARLALGSNGQVLKSNGTDIAWAADAGLVDPMTTRGDIIIRGESATTRLAKGTTGHVLKAGTNEPEWAAEYSYTLPTATGSVLGGVKVGTGLTITDSVLSADTQTVNDVIVTAAPSTDHSATGLKTTFTANENQAFGDVVYINTDGEAQLADADAIATGKVVAMAVATIAADASGSYLLQGIARDDTWNWTVGGHVYLSTTGTSGNTLTQTAPSGEDDCVVVIGVATHADRIYFNPSMLVVEVQL